MGLLERAIRRGVSNAVGKAIGDTVRQAVEPKATEFVERATQSLDDAAGRAQGQAVQASGLGNAFSGLESAAQGYATKAAQNMKICPQCEKPTSADKKFCPECGAKLPEQTIAQGAVCTACGKQNNIGTKFCQECGAKLPAAVQEEERMANKRAAVMQEWEQKLPQYPKWTCGGDQLNIEDYGDDGYMFCASFNGDTSAAHRAVADYRQILLANGFRQAGQYPSIEQLFKRIDGVVYNVDTEHCFEGDPDTACVGFCIREPYGGFDYVKPEPKKSPSLKDLFGL